MADLYLEDADSFKIIYGRNSKSLVQACQFYVSQDKNFLSARF